MSWRNHGRAVAGLLVLAAAQITNAGQWTSLGPQPLLDGPYTGRLAAVAASAVDPDLYYVGAASGGVWRTTDGGQHWLPLTDGLPTNVIGALALDPFDDQVVYAGTGEANFANHSLYGLGLYKSVDGGDTWTVLAAEHFAGRTFSRMAVSHEDPAVLYAATSRAGGFPVLNAAKGHPLAEAAVGVYRSQDGGVNWTLLGGGLPAAPASDVVVDPVDADTLYAAIGDIFGGPGNGIYKSSDGGDTWTPLSAGLPSGAGRISLAIAPNEHDRLYALITNPANATGGGASTLDIYRSDNAGSTWSPTASGNFQASYGWYLSAIIVDPDDADTLLAGGVSMVRSTNGGQTYGNATPPHVDVHGLAYDAAGNLLCANDGGLHRSPNNGGSWEALNNTLGVVQFYAGLSAHPTDPDFIIGGTQDNGTNLRQSGGDGWVGVLGGDGGYTAVRRKAPNTLFAEFQGTRNLYRSINGGLNFQLSSQGIQSTDRNAFLPPYAFIPDGSGAMLFATQRIYRSSNAGTSWTPISDDLTAGPPAAIRALAIAPSDQDTVYAATNDSRVLVSTDGGFTWALSLTDAQGWPRVTRELAVDPLDADRAYLASARFGSDRVRVTTDRGGTWSNLTGNLPDVPANTVAAHSTPLGRLVFVGTDAGVFVSCNGGDVWQAFGSGLPRSPVIDVIVDAAHGRLMAATLGRGAWAHPLPRPFDHDGNGHFDLVDFAALQACFTGPTGVNGFNPPSMVCRAAFDLNADSAIDLADLPCGFQAVDP